MAQKPRKTSQDGDATDLYDLTEFKDVPLALVSETKIAEKAGDAIKFVKRHVGLDPELLEMLGLDIHLEGVN